MSNSRGSEHIIVHKHVLCFQCTFRNVHEDKLETRTLRCWSTCL